MSAMVILEHRRVQYHALNADAVGLSGNGERLHDSWQIHSHLAAHRAQ